MQLLQSMRYSGKDKEARVTDKAAESLWASEDEAVFLRRRVLNFWNEDYLRDVVVPKLALPDGGRVLDVGSGYGGLTLLLGKLLPSVQIFGLDSEVKAVVEATQAAAEMELGNVSFCDGDAYTLPFENGVFDAVTCQTLLTHLAEPERALAEMIRVLKPGGVLFAAEYHLADFLSVFDSVMSEETPEGRLERFRLSVLYDEGKKRLGRGDNTFGVKAPFVMEQLGLEVIDVRRSDRAWHAFPPYRKAQERLALSVWRDLAQPMGETLKLWTEDNLSAGGATDEDISRYFALHDDLGLKERMREQMDAGRYRFLCSFTVYLTFASKP